MTGSLLLLLASSPDVSPGSAGLPNLALFALAEQSFAAGTASRSDSIKARAAFARSAIAYDELWKQGCHNPDLAVNRAHAHQLAGDLPKAIAAVHEGLMVTPWSRPLQVALEEARSSVGYPLVGDLANQCRPNSALTISSRMSPAEAWSIASILWLVTWAGIARFAMTRTTWWLMVAGLATVALASFGGFWLHDYRYRQRENADPLLIVTDDVLLRTGNSDGHGSALEAYPARLESRLPRGVEARQLWHRGGWVQVRLASGVIGWLPKTAVMRVE